MAKADSLKENLEQMLFNKLFNDIHAVLQKYDFKYIEFGDTFFRIKDEHKDHIIEISIKVK